MQVHQAMFVTNAFYISHTNVLTNKCLPVAVDVAGGTPERAAG